LRKLRIITLALAGLLATAAIALAAGQENTYTVTGAVTPAKAGTKAKPTPATVSFGYTVGEKNGNRPALIDQYDINFAGLQENSTAFPACTAAKIDADQSDVNCPKGSLMGTGNVENQTGSTSDTTQHSITCHLDLKFYNSGKHHAALYLHGAPNAADPAKSCPLAIDKAIDAKFVKKNGGNSIVFKVDNTLLHPITGFDNAVVKVTSKINPTRKTVKIKGKKHSFFESVGGCKNKKRAVSVTFHQVDGTSAKAKTSSKCTA
jgi:hypothetical protein